VPPLHSRRRWHRIRERQSDGDEAAPLNVIAATPASHQPPVAALVLSYSPRRKGVESSLSKVERASAIFLQLADPLIPVEIFSG